MVNVRDPLDFLTTTLLIILHVVVIVVAVRVYLAERSRTSGFLLLACIAYTLARFAWFAYDLVIQVTSLPIPKSKSATLEPWSFYSIRFFHVAFMVLIILALRTLRRGTLNHLTIR